MTLVIPCVSTCGNPPALACGGGAAVPGRSKVGSTKAFDSNARIGVTIRCAGWPTDQSFVKTNALRCSLVAAPGDGRTVCIELFLLAMPTGDVFGLGISLTLFIVYKNEERRDPVMVPPPTISTASQLPSR